MYLLIFFFHTSRFMLYILFYTLLFFPHLIICHSSLEDYSKHVGLGVEEIMNKIIAVNLPLWTTLFDKIHN